MRILYEKRDPRLRGDDKESGNKHDDGSTVNDEFLIILRRTLRKNREEQYAKDSQRFFNADEEMRCIGVRTPTVRRLARKYFRQLPSQKKGTVFPLCEQLLASGLQEESVIAFQWAAACRRQWTMNDFQRFARWYKKFVHNWAQCDDACARIFGPLTLQFPQLTKQTFLWTRSRNRWVRRAAAVSLIVPIRNNAAFLPQVFRVAEILLLDGDPMVQKGYGWMLKEASRNHAKEVFDFVMQSRATMPRTALRYAIEKFPSPKRTQAMAR